MMRLTQPAFPKGRPKWVSPADVMSRFQQAPNAGLLLIELAGNAVERVLSYDMSAPPSGPGGALV